MLKECAEELKIGDIIRKNNMYGLKGCYLKIIDIDHEKGEYKVLFLDSFTYEDTFEYTIYKDDLVNKKIKEMHQNVEVIFDSYARIKLINCGIEKMHFEDDINELIGVGVQLNYIGINLRPKMINENYIPYNIDKIETAYYLRKQETIMFEIMMYEEELHKTNKPNFNFCPYCGKKLFINDRNIRAYE